MQVADLYPSEVPDLFLGQPILLSGRYLAAGRASVRVQARLGGLPWEGRFDLQLPEWHPEGDAIATRWARARIDDLSRRLLAGPDEALVEQMTTTALAHNLVSAYTSFVAVDEQVRTAGALPRSVDVPVAIPEGVDRDMAVGVDRRLVDAVTAGAATISSAFIDSLPVLGRNQQDVLTLAPGVSGAVRGARDVKPVELQEKVRVAGTGQGSYGRAPENHKARVTAAAGGVMVGVAGGVVGGVADAPAANPGALEVTCRIESDRTSYSVAEDVVLTLTITNLSAAPIEIPAALSIADGSARLQTFDARRDRVPDPAPLRLETSRRTLQPGETATFPLVLNGEDGYELRTAGRYWIVFLGSDYGLPDSNRLTIDLGDPR